MNTPKIDKRLLAEYAELKSEEKVIADELARLQPLIKEAMNANGVDKVNTDFGAFTISSRSIWKYSPAVADLQEKEKANGTAKQLVSSSLRFTAPKAKS